MRHVPTLGLIIAGLALGADWRTACAAQWSIEPILGLLMNYNSNLLLVPANPQATAGAVLSLDTTFKGATETTELDLHPHLDLQRYVSDSALNATEGSLQGSMQYRGERSAVTLTGDYERDSTLSTELSDTGIIDTSTRYEHTSAGLSLTHELTQRQHLDVEGSYVDVTYPGGEQFGLVGYRNPSASLSDTVTVTESVALSASAFADQVTAPLVGYQSRDAGGRITATYAYSPRVTLSASGGETQTRVAGYAQHGDLWDLRASRSGELDQWTLYANRSVQPSGRGFLLLRDTIGLSLLHNFAPELFLTATFQDIRNSNLASGVFLDVPRYVSGDAGIEWHPTAHLILSLTAGEAAIREIVTYQPAHGWHTAFNVRWSPRPWTMSR